MTMEYTDTLISLLKEKPQTYAELVDGLNIGERRIRRIMSELNSQGTPIEFKTLDTKGTRAYYIDTSSKGGSSYSNSTTHHTDYFGIISDLHYGSEVCREREIEQYFDVLHDRGVKTVFNCGDTINSEGVYKGQEFENKIHGINNQCKYVVDNLPVLKNGTHHYITGNHCLKQFEHSGVEAGELISLLAQQKGRTDLNYLGRYQARVILDDYGHSIDLHHYMKGASSYTVSYRCQVRQRDEPPHKRADIVALGHKHTTLFMDYNDQLFFEAGCFQDQTDWLLSKGINPTIAGWIVELEFDGSKILRVRPELIKFDR